MNDPIGKKMHQMGPGDPLVSELEKRLGDLVGILSKFIVEKSYSEATHDGHEKLDVEHARSMCSSIIGEAEDRMTEASMTLPVVSIVTRTWTAGLDPSVSRDSG